MENMRNAWNILIELCEGLTRRDGRTLGRAWEHNTQINFTEQHTSQRIGLNWFNTASNSGLFGTR